MREFEGTVGTVNPHKGTVTIRVGNGGRVTVGPEVLEGLLHTLNYGQRVTITVNESGEVVNVRLV
jgi:cold shock CspA family protein